MDKTSDGGGLREGSPRSLAGRTGSEDNQQNKTIDDLAAIQEAVTNAKDIREFARLALNYAGDDPVMAEVFKSHLAAKHKALNLTKVFEAVRAELDHGQPPEPLDLSSHLRHVEYVVDGFIPSGITTISGATGTGKTNALVPLAASVGHLYPGELQPELRRKVVYLAEDPLQVERILFGIRGDVAISEFKDWFRVLPSRRVSPVTLANWLRQWEKDFSVDHKGFVVGPLVVLDTTNANVDIFNENDNAEVGRVLSIIREALGRSSLWLVTHTAKTIGAGSDDASSRGAGAWEGDVNATMTLIRDEKLPQKRFLVSKKARFERGFTEMMVESDVRTTAVLTPWDSWQKIPYLKMKLTALSDEGGLKHQRKKVADDAKDAADAELRRNVYEAISEAADRDDWQGWSQNQIVDHVGGNRQSVIDAVNALVKDGELVVERAGSGRTAARIHWPKNRPPKNPVPLVVPYKGKSPEQVEDGSEL